MVVVGIRGTVAEVWIRGVSEHVGIRGVSEDVGIKWLVEVTSGIDEVNSCSESIGLDEGVAVVVVGTRMSVVGISGVVVVVGTRVGGAELEGQEAVKEMAVSVVVGRSVSAGISTKQGELVEWEGDTPSAVVVVAALVAAVVVEDNRGCKESKVDGTRSAVSGIKGTTISGDKTWLCGSFDVDTSTSGECRRLPMIGESTDIIESTAS